jgi:hypothetical protein
MPKYLDMPEGNGICAAYANFKEQIDRDRAVAVVRVVDKEGDFACFITSGDPIAKITEENAMAYVVALVYHTRLTAEADGNHPVVGRTSELV